SEKYLFLHAKPCGSRAQIKGHDPQGYSSAGVHFKFSLHAPSRGINERPAYLVGLTTTTVPPKFRSLFELRAAMMAAAIAPPAASSNAARAPPLSLPKVSSRRRRTQRVPGCAVPASPV